MVDNVTSEKPLVAAYEEQALIGSLLLDNSVADTCVARELSTADFTTNAHKALYEVMLYLHQEGSAIDAVTVAGELDRRKRLQMVGGLAKIVDLGEVAPRPSSVDTYIDAILEMSARREIVRIAQENYTEGVKGNRTAGEMRESLLEAARSSSERLSHARVIACLEAALALSRALDDRLNGKEGATLNVGYSRLTESGLFNRRDYLIIAARPGVGKTALALNLTARSAALGLSVLFISAEMPVDRLMMRLVASKAQIDSRDIARGLFPMEREKALRELSGMPIRWYYGPGATIDRIRGVAISAHSEQPIDMLIIDYLQLMEGDRRQGREQQVAAVSRGLARLAGELGCAVVALSQLNREIEKRPNKEPQLSDLRESGSLEQDPDTVLMVNRPGIYDDSINPEVMQVFVRKARNGGEGRFELRFDRKTQTIWDPYEDQMNLPGQ